MTHTVHPGVLTRFSNTVLEPLTKAIAAGISGASAHLSRFRVSEISLEAQAPGQFDDRKSSPQPNG